MHIFVSGTSICFSTEPPEKLTPDPSADQINPQNHYVYAHVDPTGKLFYIGKGQRRRAWDSDNRHFLWDRYVQTRCDGKFVVKILADRLDAETAEYQESLWMAQEVNTLVNWANMARPRDFKANELYWKLRKQNKALAEQAKSLEKTDPVAAIGLYLKIIDAIEGYAFIQHELGLVGELEAEIRRENGYHGEVQYLDRLTLVQVKQGLVEEAEHATSAYFAKYKGALNSALAEKIYARLSKARAKMEKNNATS